jgi:hypothetical protein
MRPRIAFNRASSQKRREDACALQKSGYLPDEIMMARLLNSIPTPWKAVSYAQASLSGIHGILLTRRRCL